MAAISRGERTAKPNFQNSGQTAEFPLKRKGEVQENQCCSKH